MRFLWLIPATASVAFFLFSAWVVATDGPLGFAAEHTRNAWGAQIGLDLANSLLVALIFAVPAARRHRVRAWPWVLLTCGTGSVGLFALLARVAHAEYARAEGSRLEREGALDDAASSPGAVVARKDGP
jgi:hypothetical protein